MKTPEQRLTEANACSAARHWVRRFANMKQAWDACENVTWLMWWVYRTDPRYLEFTEMMARKCIEASQPDWMMYWNCSFDTSRLRELHLKYEILNDVLFDVLNSVLNMRCHDSNGRFPNTSSVVYMSISNILGRKYVIEQIKFWFPRPKLRERKWE